MVSALKLAITGGTGFVGQRLIDLALGRGHHLRALTRRPQPERDGITWVEGALDQPDRLANLVDGVDAVVHVAGVVNAPDTAGFETGNVSGTRAILAAAEAAAVPRFVHISSLAAREPQLSMYGASKALSETVVAASALSTAIVRPPAVYGPGDREMLDMFKMARRGFIVLPPAGRLSLIHVDDLARLLLDLAASPEFGVIEPDDGRVGGWTHDEFANALAAAFGRDRVVTWSAAPFLMKIAARADRLARGAGAKLTADRAAYFCHPDWVVDPARAPVAWCAAIPTSQGLADTVTWYKAQGWL